MKIFVTGATGNIGAHLITKLSNAGHTVHALVRSKAKCTALAMENVFFFEGDITNPKSIDAAMQGCEQVYHLAALAKVWAKDTGDFYRINVIGTNNVLESAHRFGIQKVVVTSTAGVYGPSLTGIVHEGKVRDIDFFNEYEGSKALSESHIKDFVVQRGMDIVIVSPTRVYGPFIFGEIAAVTIMMDKFVNGSWRIYPGTGKEIGNYIYIDDVVDGHLLAMEKGKTGHTYILGGENIDYIQFYSMLSTSAGIKRKMLRLPLFFQLAFAKFQLFLANTFSVEPVIVPKWVSKGKYNWEVSPEKAVRELGLPVTPIQEGFQKTVSYLQSKSK
jgi:farnesol dehydrogenase